MELEGYTTYTASNGQEGLDILSQISSPSLILLDLMMPVMNGWEFVESIKKIKKLSKIPIVIISAFYDQSNNIPVQGHLKKPIALANLYKTIKDLEVTNEQNA